MVTEQPTALIAPPEPALRDSLNTEERIFKADPVP